MFACSNTQAARRNQTQTAIPQAIEGLAQSVFQTYKEDLIENKEAIVHIAKLLPNLYAFSKETLLIVLEKLKETMKELEPTTHAYEQTMKNTLKQERTKTSLDAIVEMLVKILKDIEQNSVPAIQKAAANFIADSKNEIFS